MGRRVTALLDEMGSSLWLSPKDIPENGKVVLRPLACRRPKDGWPIEVERGEIVIEEEFEDRPFWVGQLIHFVDGAGEGGKKKTFRCRRTYYREMTKKKGKPYSCPFCDLSKVLQASADKSDKEAGRDLSMILKCVMNVVDQDGTIRYFSFMQKTILKQIRELAEDCGNLGDKNTGRKLVIRKLNEKGRISYTVRAMDAEPVGDYQGTIKNLVELCLETDSISIAEGRELLLENYNAGQFFPKWGQ